MLFHFKGRIFFVGGADERQAKVHYTESYDILEDRVYKHAECDVSAGNPLDSVTVGAGRFLAVIGPNYVLDIKRNR